MVKPCYWLFLYWNKNDIFFSMFTKWQQMFKKHNLAFKSRSANTSSKVPPSVNLAA